MQANLNIEQKSDSFSSEFSPNISVFEKPEESVSLKEFGLHVLEVTKGYNSSRTFYDSEPKENNPSWLLFVLLFSFSLFTFVRAFHRKRLKLLTKSLLSWKFGKQIIRYEKLYTHPVNFALVVNFLISIPLFFAICFNQYTGSLFSLSSISIILACYLLGFAIFKLLVYKFSAWVINCSEEMKEYIFQANLIAKFLGLTFSVLTILLCYSFIDFKILFSIGISVLIVGIGLQLIRGFLIALQKSKDLILIILYLCTLEFLPLIIMGKLVLNEL